MSEFWLSFQEEQKWFGSFGKVVKIKTRKKLRAIKYADDLRKEIEILLIANNHPNIIKMFSYFSGVGPWIEMEFGNFSVQDMINNARIDLENFKIILKGLLSGLSYLQELEIAHLDLKPSNIVFVKNKVKIIDFGSSEIRENALMVLNSLTSESYAPPEWGKNYCNGFLFDMWSLGITLVTILTGDNPWYCAHKMCSKYEEWLLNKTFSVPIVNIDPKIFDQINKYLLRVDSNERRLAATLHINDFLL